MSQENEKQKNSQAFERLKTLMFPSFVAGLDSREVVSSELLIESKPDQKYVLVETNFYPGQNHIGLTVSRGSKTILGYTLNNEGLKSLRIGSLNLSLGEFGDVGLDGEIVIGGNSGNGLTLRNTDNVGRFRDFADKLVDWTENLLKKRSFEELPAVFRMVPPGK